MAEGYFTNDETRAQRVRDLFDTIAPRYDFINDLQSLWLHHRWKRRLVRLAKIKPGQRALDLCCGTGDIARTLAAQGAKVTAIDFSGPMLKIARKRKTSTDIEYIKGDALNTNQPAEHFDAVTIAYGLRNLADFDAGLREMHRVAKPGGRLCVLDFGKPSNRLIRFGCESYLKWIVPRLGQWLCKDAPAYAYIHESLADYPAQAGITQAMENLGCKKIETHNLLLGAMAISIGIK